MLKIRYSLPVRRMVLLGVPLLAVVISAVLAFLGNQKRANIEVDLQRHFQMDRSLGEVLTRMVNAETGMRGYLLTQRHEFLQPYATASQDLPAALAHLRALAEAEPELSPRFKKLHRLNQLQLLINQQMSDLAIQQQSSEMPKKFNIDIYSHLAYGKRLMDEIRSILSAMQTEEGLLLTKRLQEINAIRQRDYLAIFFILFLALGTRLISWHLFNTGVLRRIKHLVENVRSLRRGEPLPFQPSDKPDELGDLEQEIVLASEQSSPRTASREPTQGNLSSTK